MQRRPHLPTASPTPSGYTGFLGKTAGPPNQPPHPPQSFLPGAAGAGGSIPPSTPYGLLYNPRHHVSPLTAGSREFQHYGTPPTGYGIYPGSFCMRTGDMEPPRHPDPTRKRPSMLSNFMATTTYGSPGSGTGDEEPPSGKRLKTGLSSLFTIKKKSTGEIKKEPGEVGGGQSERSSPSPSATEELEGIQLERDKILERIKLVETEIDVVSNQIKHLKKNQQDLEEHVNTAQADNVAKAETSQMSKFERIYAENRKRAETSHAKMAKLMGGFARPPGSAPLYREPSDIPALQEIKRRHETFRPKLIEYILQKQRTERLREKYLVNQYKKQEAKWKKKVDKWEKSAKKAERDEKFREIFEKTFPEVRKQREEKERMNRIETRSGQLAAKYDMEAKIVAQNEQDEEDRRIRENAVVVPLVLDVGFRKVYGFVNKNGLVRNPAVAHQQRLMLFRIRWSDTDKGIFREKLNQYGKNFAAIAEFLPGKTTSDCVQYYYLTKKEADYKPLLRKFKRKAGGRAYKPPSVPKPAGSLIGQKEEPEDGNSNQEMPEEKEVFCINCATKIESDEASRILTRSLYEQFGLDNQDPANAELRICQKCYLNFLKKKHSSSNCGIGTCNTLKKRMKFNKLPPPRWEELTSEQQSSIFESFEFTEETTKCCSTCFRRIARKMDPFLTDPETEGVWNPEQISALKSAIMAHGADNWEQVAKVVQSKSWQECETYFKENSTEFDSKPTPKPPVPMPPDKLFVQGIEESDEENSFSDVIPESSTGPKQTTEDTKPPVGVSKTSEEVQAVTILPPSSESGRALRIVIKPQPTPRPLPAKVPPVTVTTSVPATTAASTATVAPSGTPVPPSKGGSETESEQEQEPEPIPPEDDTDSNATLSADEDSSCQGAVPMGTTHAVVKVTIAAERSTSTAAAVVKAPATPVSCSTATSLTLSPRPIVAMATGTPGTGTPNKTAVTMVTTVPCTQGTPVPTVTTVSASVSLVTAPTSTSCSSKLTFARAIEVMKPTQRTTAISRPGDGAWNLTFLGQPSTERAMERGALGKYGSAILPTQLPRLSPSGDASAEASKDQVHHSQQQPKVGSPEKPAWMTKPTEPVMTSRPCLTPGGGKPVSPRRMSSPRLLADSPGQTSRPVGLPHRPFDTSKIEDTVTEVAKRMLASPDADQSKPMIPQAQTIHHQPTARPVPSIKVEPPEVGERVRPAEKLEAGLFASVISKVEKTESLGPTLQTGSISQGTPLRATLTADKLLPKIPTAVSVSTPVPASIHGSPMDRLSSSSRGSPLECQGRPASSLMPPTSSLGTSATDSMVSHGGHYARPPETAAGKEVEAAYSASMLNQAIRQQQQLEQARLEQLEQRQRILATAAAYPHVLTDPRSAALVEQTQRAIELEQRQLSLMHLAESERAAICAQLEKQQAQEAVLKQHILQTALYSQQLALQQAAVASSAAHRAHHASTAESSSGAQTPELRLGSNYSPLQHQHSLHHHLSGTSYSPVPSQLAQMQQLARGVSPHTLPTSKYPTPNYLTGVPGPGTPSSGVTSPTAPFRTKAAMKELPPLTPSGAGLGVDYSAGKLIEDIVRTEVVRSPGRLGTPGRVMVATPPANLGGGSPGLSSLIRGRGEQQHQFLTHHHPQFVDPHQHGAHTPGFSYQLEPVSPPDGGTLAKAKASAEWAQRSELSRQAQVQPVAVSVTPNAYVATWNAYAQAMGQQQQAQRNLALSQKSQIHMARPKPETKPTYEPLSDEDN